MLSVIHGVSTECRTMPTFDRSFAQLDATTLVPPLPSLTAAGAVVAQILEVARCAVMRMLDHIVRFRGGNSEPDPRDPIPDPGPPGAGQSLTRSARDRIGTISIEQIGGLVHQQTQGDTCADTGKAAVGVV